jgi:ribosome-binding protein aMBF1 (putative translation factor)
MSIWTEKVKALKACGMSYTDIAAAIHLKPSTVCDLAAGRYKAPGADAAMLLHALHAEKCEGAKPSKNEAA